jgi:tripartite-type tricarboxylate transporter receptor subunit TctC
MRAILLIVLSLVGLSDATAQPYPHKPITIIVPFAAGGATDAIARLVSRYMAAELGQSIIVENVGGAGGTIGTMRVVKAEPDGYTLTFGHIGTLAANAALYARLNYDPRRDITPIGVAVRNPMVLAVSNRSGVRNFEGFKDYLSRKADQVTFGTAGAGSQTDLASALFLFMSGQKATRVPYRGSGPAINDLVAGHIDAVIEQTLTLIPLHNDRSVHALAVNTNERISQMADVPTFKELGLPQFDAKVWQALAGPPGLPDSIVNRLAQSLESALQNDDVKKRFDDLAAEIPPVKERGPRAMKGLIESEVPRWTKVIQDAGITVQ